MAALAMYGCGTAYALATTAARNEGLSSHAGLFVGLLQFALACFASARRC